MDDEEDSILSAEAGLWSGRAADERAFVKISTVYESAHGMCRVMKGSRHGKWYALKCLKEEYRDVDACRQWLRREFEAGYMLDHTGIARTLDYVELPETGEAVVTEWVDGVRLSDFMDSPRWNAEAARRIALELVDALDHIHSHQTVYCDLKPGNVMITRTGDHVKIVDFGLAASAGFDFPDVKGYTRRYASPEQLAGKEADYRSDYYSLGVMLREMAGKGVPGLGKAAALCMRANPPDRAQSAREIRDAIGAGTGRRRGVAAIWAAVAVTVACMAALALWPEGEKEVPHEEVSPTVETAEPVARTEDETIPEAGSDVHTVEEASVEVAHPARKTSVNDEAYARGEEIGRMVVEMEGNEGDVDALCDKAVAEAGRWAQETYGKEPVLVLILKEIAGAGAKAAVLRAASACEEGKTEAETVGVARADTVSEV